MNAPNTGPASGKNTPTRAINIISGGIGNYPIKLELVPKRLAVSIYQHKLMGRGSHIPCWIFITHGMQAFRQKEFVLAIRIEEAEDFNRFPKPPVQLFMHLFKAVSQKKRFHIGSVTPLGEKGFMGFAGLGYTHELINVKDIELPASYLSCVFLTKEELIAARTLGLTRLLARMGFEQNRFPINPWNEMKRNGLPMHAVIKQSEFKNIPTMNLDYCSVNLVNGDTVTLVLTPLVQAQLAKFLKDNNNPRQFGLITQLFSYHEGALVWLPLKEQVEMNLHPDSDGELIAGGFALFRRDEHCGAAMLEDGFVINLDESGWASFRNALLAKQNIQLPASGADMAFQLIWNPSRNPDVNSGLGQTLADNSESEEPASGLVGKLKGLFKR